LKKFKRKKEAENIIIQREISGETRVKIYNNNKVLDIFFSLVDSSKKEKKNITKYFNKNKRYTTIFSIEETSEGIALDLITIENIKKLSAVEKQDFLIGLSNNTLVA
jgi:hypothetical protein